MRIFAAMSGLKSLQLAVTRVKVNNILLSFHYFKRFSKEIQELRKTHKFHLFIDSGAFSAQSQGVGININQYMEYVREVKPDMYAGLDVIGDAEKSEENTSIMEKEGLKPIPTFHTKEPFKFLRKMAEEYNHIALGGLVGKRSEQQELWLDDAWREILLVNPKIKVHGFGMTNREILLKFPWSSVDSSGYSSGTKWGGVYIYDEERGGLIQGDMHSFLRKKFEESGGDTRFIHNKSFRWDEVFCQSVSIIEHLENEVNKKKEGKDYSFIKNQGLLFERE